MFKKKCGGGESGRGLILSETYIVYNRSYMYVFAIVTMVTDISLQMYNMPICYLDV